MKKITGYGAFVEFPDGKRGLVHISEIADTYVRDINDFLKEGQKVKVKVLTVNEDGKMDLSIRQTQKTSSPRENKRGFAKDSSSDNKISFEDKLAKFLKESEERLLDLKRNTESKRGGGRRR